MAHDKALFPLLSIILLSLSVTYGNAQCSYLFKVTARTELSTGTIEVDVKAKGTFIVELYSDKGVERILVETRRATGNEKIKFTGLAVTGNIYRVAVNSPAEDNFLCKKKMSEEISFEIN